MLLLGHGGEVISGTEGPTAPSADLEPEHDRVPASGTLPGASYRRAVPRVPANNIVLNTELLRIHKIERIQRDSVIGRAIRLLQPQRNRRSRRPQGLEIRCVLTSNILLIFRVPGSQAYLRLLTGADEVSLFPSSFHDETFGIARDRHRRKDKDDCGATGHRPARPKSARRSRRAEEGDATEQHEGQCPVEQAEPGMVRNMRLISQEGRWRPTNGGVIREATRSTTYPVMMVAKTPRATDAGATRERHAQPTSAPSAHTANSATTMGASGMKSPGRGGRKLVDHRTHAPMTAAETTSARQAAAHTPKTTRMIAVVALEDTRMRSLAQANRPDSMAAIPAQRGRMNTEENASVSMATGHS